jgi:hypothetical protein
VETSHRMIRGASGMAGSEQALKSKHGPLAEPDAPRTKPDLVLIADSDSVRKARVRHLAARQGLELRKQRDSTDASWMIFDPRSNVTIVERCTLDEADHRLREGVVHPLASWPAPGLVSVSG